jgi:hypothetical protein
MSGTVRVCTDNILPGCLRLQRYGTAVLSPLIQGMIAGHVPCSISQQFGSSRECAAWEQWRLSIGEPEALGLIGNSGAMADLDEGLADACLISNGIQELPRMVP